MMLALLLVCAPGVWLKAAEAEEMSKVMYPDLMVDLSDCPGGFEEARERVYRRMEIACVPDDYLSRFNREWQEEYRSLHGTRVAVNDHALVLSKFIQFAAGWITIVVDGEPVNVDS